jgi:D-alanyl-D-alanine carboxypeptidase
MAAVATERGQGDDRDAGQQHRRLRQLLHRRVDRDLPSGSLPPWTPAELISISTSQPLDFAPGTSWSFSDSNFVILGQVLAKAGRAPVPQQIQRLILNPLDLHDTQMTPTSYIPSPVLHAYDSERGDNQDSTFWSISWAPNNGDMTSDLSDLGHWAKTLGTGALLSAKSRARQFAPGTVGLGPFTTPKLYYGLGGLVANKWILAEPGLIGYTGTVAYLPAQKLSVVIFTTANPMPLRAGSTPCPSSTKWHRRWLPRRHPRCRAH